MSFSFKAMETYIKDVAKDNDGLIKLSIEGHTEEGRPIYMLEIGTSPMGAKTRAVFIDAGFHAKLVYSLAAFSSLFRNIVGIHAREWIAPTTAFYIINQLVKTFKSNPSDPRTKVNYYIMPILNPDGYEYSRTTDRMWRKNRAAPPLGSKCFGVDLNRNYDVIGYGVGASRNPCSDQYEGRKPNSEPEVAAASSVVQRHRDNIRVSLSLHSYGTIYFIGWSAKRSNYYILCRVCCTHIL
jgi:murein tripeptide amidase MpaA